MKSLSSKTLLKKSTHVSQALKSLAHPVRLRILCHLLDQERTVGELTEFCGTSQSAMSQFLDRMKRDELISSRREGTRIYYRFANVQARKLLHSVQSIYC